MAYSVKNIIWKTRSL